MYCYSFFFTHIHFTETLDGVVGYRHNADVFIYINMKSAILAGHKFYISENRVILSEGPIKPEHFLHLTDRNGNMITYV